MGHEMGETVLVFDGKRAKIEPANASRVGSGYRETIGETVQVFASFDEAIADAVGYMFTV